MTCSFNELRLLGSSHFDSQCLLTVILCGDNRLPERFRSSDLIALGSRMRLRMMLDSYDKTILNNYLEHSLQHAGTPHLMTKELMATLVDHAAGNLRLLNTMAAELLDVGAQKELTKLDEKLFLEVFSRQPTTRKRPRQ